MFENIAAIDIGTCSIKVVTVRTGLTDFQIKNMLYKDIDFEVENKDDAIKDALLKIIDEAELQGYTILTNIPQEKTIIRNLVFPFNDMYKIAEAIPFEAEENIPFQLDDVIIDFLPLKNKDTKEGKILLSAVHKDNIHDFLIPLKDVNLQPIRIGMESMALFECYRYFNKVSDETIIQIDIGHNKTIVNIISNNNLLYTRSISLGISLIYKYISELCQISYSEAIKLLEDLNLDLTSLDNNLQRDYYKTIKLNKRKLENIYNNSIGIFNDLLEQISLTIRSFFTEFKKIEFTRIIISGGASNINGIGTILSKELLLPVVSLPFLKEYPESKIQTQFPIAFGTILSYLEKKYKSINFLKDEFSLSSAKSSWRIYYLSGVFSFLTVILLIINIILSSYLKSETNQKYNDILNKRLKNYFHTSDVTENPISEAMKILKKEKKELENLDVFLISKENMLDILNNLLSFFPKDETFELKNIVINERIIKVNGLIESSINIDEFKNKLIESKKFESVTLNTNIKRKNKVRFSMSIKLKLENKPTKKTGKE